MFTPLWNLKVPWFNKIWKFPEYVFPSVQKEKLTRYAFSFSFDSFVVLNAIIVKKIIQHEKCATDFDSAIKLFVPPPHLNRPLPPCLLTCFALSEFLYKSVLAVRCGVSIKYVFLSLQYILCSLPPLTYFFHESCKKELSRVFFLRWPRGLGRGREGAGWGGQSKLKSCYRK